MIRGPPWSFSKKYFVDFFLKVSRPILKSSTFLFIRSSLFIIISRSKKKNKTYYMNIKYTVPVFFNLNSRLIHNIKLVQMFYQIEKHTLMSKN